VWFGAEEPGTFGAAAISGNAVTARISLYMPG
jgi:hypothetical protein